MIKRGAVGHQRGYGQDAPPMGFDDAIIYIRRETKVIGIYHQPTCAQLTP